MTYNSVTSDPLSSISWIELTGISYVTSYSFDGIYGNDINLGKFRLL